MRAGTLKRGDDPHGMRFSLWPSPTVASERRSGLVGQHASPHLSIPAKAVFYAIIAATLQGCAAVSALLPTAVPCVNKADVPAFPKIASNEELAAMQDYALILTLGAERGELLVYARQAEPILRACSR